MFSTTKLNIEVHTTNEFNRVIKLELAHILPLLVAFIGKKIFTLNGRAKSFEIAFLKPIVTPFNNGHAQIDRCYLTNHYGQLALAFRICFNGGSYETTPRTAYTEYLERTIVLGDLDGDKLKDLKTLESIITNYGFDTILNAKNEIEAIEEYARLKALTDAAKSKIKVSTDIYRYI